MASGDIALHILMTAEAAPALGVIAGMGSSIVKTFAGMGNGVGNLIFGFRNLGTEGTIGMQAIMQGSTQVAGNLLKLVAILGMVAGIVVLALAVAGAKAAGDFQAQMTRLVTSAGELPQNLKMVSAGILQMSVDTATSTSQLAAGMYFVESAGYHAADGLNVLKVAAMGAKSENADLDVVTKALTTEMVDYHMKSGQAASAMNGLVAAVQNGKTNLQDLASSMGAVLPIASALGISFPQVAGAMDTMTNAGMSSRQAAMNLAHVLLALSSPSGVAVKALASVGLSAQEVKDALVHKGLPEALQMIEDAVGKKFPQGSVAYETAIKNATGGIMGFKLAAMLTGKSLEETQQNIAKVAAAMNQGKNGVMGWTEVQGTFNFKLDQAKMAFQALLITLGTALLPILGNLLTSVSNLVGRFSSWMTSGHAMQGVLGTVVTLATNLWNSLVNLGTAVFNLLNKSGLLQTVMNGLGFAFGAVVAAATWLANTLASIFNWVSQNEIAMDTFKAALILIAFVIGTILVGALLIYIATVAIAAVENVIAFWPLYLVILIIVAIIAVVILIVQHWGQIMSWLGGVAHVVISAIGSAFSWLGSLAQTVIHAIGGFFSWLGTQVHNFITGVKNTVGGWFSGLGTLAHNALAAVGGWFSWLGTQVHNFITNIQNFFVNFGSWLYNHNYFVKAFVDWCTNAQKTVEKFVTFITGKIGDFFSFLGTKANDAKNFVGQKFSDLGTTIKGAWDGVRTNVGNFFSFLGTKANDAKNVVGQKFSDLGTHTKSVWDGIRTNVGNFFSFLGSKANDGKNTVGQAFDWLGTHAHDVFNGLTTWFGNFFSGLGSKFHDWGSNLLQMFTNGFNAAMGGLINAAQGLANKLKSFLGFHSPTKEGPGSTADQWAPNFVKMYAQGIREGIPLIHSAISDLSNVAFSNSAFAAHGNAFALSGNHTVVVQSQPAPIYLDKRQIGQILFNYQADELRRRGGVQNR